MNRMPKFAIVKTKPVKVKFIEVETDPYPFRVQESEYMSDFDMNLVDFVDENIKELKKSVLTFPLVVNMLYKDGKMSDRVKKYLMSIYEGLR